MSPDEIQKLQLIGASMKNVHNEWLYAAANLIDGNYDNIAHTTDVNDGIWIRVNLAQTSQVFKIAIYNRKDCCKDRITGISVYIKQNDKDVKYCATIKAKIDKYVFVCRGLGNVIELRADGSISAQNIAEIEVSGSLVPGARGLIIILITTPERVTLTAHEQKVELGLPS